MRGCALPRGIQRCGRQGSRFLFSWMGFAGTTFLCLLFPEFAVFIEDEDEFPAPFFLDEIPEIGKTEEIRPGGLIHGVILLHDLADGEVFVALLHHRAEDVPFPLVDTRYLFYDCLGFVLLG